MWMTRDTLVLRKSANILFKDSLKLNFPFTGPEQLDAWRPQKKGGGEHTNKNKKDEFISSLQNPS
jgi:hypothetical protein